MPAPDGLHDHCDSRGLKASSSITRVRLSICTRIGTVWTFACAPGRSSLGRLRIGLLTFTVEGVIVADIPISIYVGNRPMTAEMVTASGRPYRSIFCSYTAGIRASSSALTSLQGPLGIEYLRDVVSLRSGEPWQLALLSMIQRADIFQLSGRAMRSGRSTWKMSGGMLCGSAANHRGSSARFTGRSRCPPHRRSWGISALPSSPNWPRGSDGLYPTFIGLSSAFGPNHNRLFDGR